MTTHFTDTQESIPLTPGEEVDGGTVKLVSSRHGEEVAATLKRIY